MWLLSKIILTSAYQDIIRRKVFDPLNSLKTTLFHQIELDQKLGKIYSMLHLPLEKSILCFQLHIGLFL